MCTPHPAHTHPIHPLSPPTSPPLPPLPIPPMCHTAMSLPSPDPAPWCFWMNSGRALRCGRALPWPGRSWSGLWPRAAAGCLPPTCTCCTSCRWTYRGYSGGAWRWWRGSGRGRVLTRWQVGNRGERMLVLRAFYEFMFGRHRATSQQIPFHLSVEGLHPMSLVLVGTQHHNVRDPICSHAALPQGLPKPWPVSFMTSTPRHPARRLRAPLLAPHLAHLGAGVAGVYFTYMYI